MVSSFDEFNVMLQEHPFDILTIRNLIKRLCKFTIISLVTRTEMKEEEGLPVYISKIQLNAKNAMILTR